MIAAVWHNVAYLGLLRSHAAVLPCQMDELVSATCRKNFDKWWKGTWTTVKIPGKGTIYDYFVNFKTSKFTPWTDLVTDIDYESSMPMSSLFVPTAETSSLRFFLDLMVNLRKPIMFVGGAGVGKCSTAVLHI